jgi:hypothetical protein
MINGLQIRAARGFLTWDRRDLAKKAVMERYPARRWSRESAVKAALEAEGIEFTDDKGVAGVRLHPKKRKG